MVEGKRVGDFHGRSVVKNLPRIHPSMQEVWVQSLPQKDSLQKEIATHPSIFAWKIPWTEKSGRLQSMGSQRVTRLATKQQMEVRASPSAQMLTPLNWQSVGKNFYRQREGASYRKSTVSSDSHLQLVMDGLTRVLLVVSSSVNLLFHGWLVLISLRTILGTVAACIMATVWSSCS